MSKMVTFGAPYRISRVDEDPDCVGKYCSLDLIECMDLGLVHVWWICINNLFYIRQSNCVYYFKHESFGC